MESILTFPCFTCVFCHTIIPGQSRINDTTNLAISELIFREKNAYEFLMMNAIEMKPSVSAVILMPLFSLFRVSSIAVAYLFVSFDNVSSVSYSRELRITLHIIQILNSLLK